MKRLLQKTPIIMYVAMCTSSEPDLPKTAAIPAAHGSKGKFLVDCYGMIQLAWTGDFSGNIPRVVTVMV